MTTLPPIIRFDKAQPYVFNENHFNLEPVKLVKTKGKVQVEVAVANIRYNGDPRGETKVRMPKFASYTGFITSTKKPGTHNIVYNMRKDGTPEEKACYEFFVALDEWKNKMIPKIVKESISGPKKVFTVEKRIDHAKQIINEPDKYIKPIMDYPRREANDFKPETDKEKCIWIEANQEEATLTMKGFDKKAITMDKMVADKDNKMQGKGEYIIIIKLGAVFIGEHGTNQVYLASIRPKALQIYYNDKPNDIDDDDILGESLVLPESLAKLEIETPPHSSNGDIDDDVRSVFE